MNVLIAYGSKRGGTVGLSHMIADAFAKEAITPDVRPAREVGSTYPYDAVVIVGALYANRWHKDARTFVRRRANELRLIPTWFVASGPLDDSATIHEITPTHQIEKLMRRTRARGYKVFGGRLKPDTTGMLARRLARTHAGDWRDTRAIHCWVKTVTGYLWHPANTTKMSTNKGGRP